MRQEYLSSAVNVLKKTVLRFLIRVKQSFFNSIYVKFMGKKDNSRPLLLSAVFETR